VRDDRASLVAPDVVLERRDVEVADVRSALAGPRRRPTGLRELLEKASLCAQLLVGVGVRLVAQAGT
jgi:hypothetical protein